MSHEHFQLVEYVSSNLNMKKFTNTIFLNVSKAFSSLASPLSGKVGDFKYCFSHGSLFLQSRTFKVKRNSTRTSKFRMEAEVP